MPKNPTRFAMIEMNSQSDIYFNLVAIEYATSQAVANGAAFVIVPENAFSFGNHKVASQHYQTLKDWCSQLARTHNIHFVAGSLPCPFRPDGTPVPDGKFRQTSLLFDPAGDCLARYDKIHLFKAQVKTPLKSADIAHGQDAPKNQILYYDEGKTFEAGSTPVVVKTALGNIGLMVCFDLRFAEMAKYLRQQGADILTAPSAFVYETGKLNWQTLIQARALDAQCMLIGLGQTGTHYLPATPQKKLATYPDSQVNFATHTAPQDKVENQQTRHTWGHSQFINASGQVMAMTTLEANPFSNNNQSTTPAQTATPLAKQALSWLNADSNNADTKNDGILHLPQTVTLHLTDFDPSEQEIFRQNIALAQSERFGITPPLV